MNDAWRDSSEDARAAVTSALGPADWRLESLGGSSGTAWLATATRRVVVRLNADRAVLARVAEIGIAPSVLAAGEIDGRRYVIQELIDGPSPSTAWLREHADDVARLFSTLAADVALSKLEEPLAAVDFAETLLASGRAAGLDPGRLGRVERLAAEAPSTAPTEWVGSHGDPNRSNFLKGDRLILVDWDEFRVADRMRDGGPFAWWYLPESQWPSFFEATGTRWSAAVERRIYWWAAAESLDVGIRLLASERTAAQGFLIDFDHAAERRGNPRRHG